LLTLRTTGTIGASLVLLVAVLAAGAGAGVASLLGGGDSAPSATATSEIPAAMLTLYEQAAASCPGLPWSVLAAIGQVESDQGRDDATSSAGAEGPMQFLPSTFAEYDEPVPPGGANPPSPDDPTDAIYAAARDLCANGARDGADLSAAVFDYNHSESYVAEVLDLANSYGETAAEAVATSTAGGIALDWALAQVGTPYVWGGETPGVGFDCSGLVQAAYKVAGISLPRGAQDQFDAGPELGSGTILEPGDLVFFGGGPDSVSHVGLYVGVRNGQAMMVDAPHSGADVRVEAFPPTVGVSWGSELVVGFTRPG